MRDDRHIFGTALSDETRRLRIQLTADQLGALTAHYALIVKWNEHVRLVGTTDPARAAIELFADSLIINKFIEARDHKLFAHFDRPIRSVDIGAGAGLPGIPLKILRPEWDLVVIESSVKKISFIKTAVRELHLEGVDAVRGRAEELAHNGDFREKFDLAFCRAVASPARACELALPFLKVGGIFIVQGTLRQWSEGIYSTAHMLGSNIEESIGYELAEVTARRLLVCIKKLRPTSSIYPRKEARKAKKKPPA